MEKYLRLVLDRSGLVLACLLPLVLAAGWFVQDFQLDASSDSLVQEGDRDLNFYREINARYRN